jgi:ABC-2 type transport system permease protein
MWGLVFGISTASSAVSYTTIYKTQAQRDALATAYGSNKATSALCGPAPALQSVAGFTVFKVSMTLAIPGAVWGLLASTRLLRGEEGSGRWDLILAGQTNARKATCHALGGLAFGAIVIWVLTSVMTAAAGLDSKVDISVGAAMYFAFAMVATAVMFLAVGALTSQLGATRRQAAS